MASTGTEIMSITDDDLLGIESFDDAVNLLQDRLGAEITATDDIEFGISNGFLLIDQHGGKDALIGKPFIIIGSYFREGDFGEGGFVSLEVVTDTNEKWIVNDGSTGLRDDVARMIAKRAAYKNADGSPRFPHPDKGILARQGLTKSEYWYNEETKEKSKRKPDGKGWIPATTYYLA